MSTSTSQSALLRPAHILSHSLQRLFQRQNRDLAGISCSALCISHCLLTPLLLSSTAASSLTGVTLALSGEQAHQWLLVLVWLLALLSFPAGWMQHRRWQPLFAAFAGLALLTGATQFHGELETSFTLFGGLLMAVAHWQNRKSLRIALASKSRTPATKDLPS